MYPIQPHAQFEVFQIKAVYAGDSVQICTGGVPGPGGSPDARLSRVARVTKAYRTSKQTPIETAASWLMCFLLLTLVDWPLNYVQAQRIITCWQGV